MMHTHHHNIIKETEYRMQVFRAEAEAHHQVKMVIAGGKQRRFWWVSRIVSSMIGRYRRSRAVISVKQMDRRPTSTTTTPAPLDTWAN